MLFKRVICCLRGLCAVQMGYMDFPFLDPSKGCEGERNTVQGGYMLFRGGICCSGGLYAVQAGYMNFQGGYMWKIMVKIVATIVVASRPPNGDRLQRRPLVPKL